LILLNLVLLVVGCLMDTYSAILIVSPLIIPIAEFFGLSAVHTGVIFLMNMEIGFITPPVGMNLFIASYTFNVPVLRVVRGILPFLLVQLAVLFLVTYIPWFSSALL
jgi:TRAP-type C4-dicarboxylate transport system permease large subunit